MTTNWKNQNVVIIGAARQGLALARYLAQHGARVILNDRRQPDDLRDEMKSLATFDITWALGSHDPQLATAANAVFVSGGVPLENPIIEAARQRGIPVSNDTQVFMQAVPCKTIGITGSAGKTTTTTLVGRMAQAASEGLYDRAWIGGNIGDPLINYVDEMQASDLAILEISSFQAELMTTAPDIAAILNITPNHLDRHGTMDNYIAAKANIVRHQTASGIAILGRDDPGAWGLASLARGRLFSFGFSPLPAGTDGAYAQDERFFIRDGAQVIPLPVADAIELRGEHNRLNVLAAYMIAHAAGLSTQAMLAGVQGFRGVAHRLEFVRTWRGAQWYNDSIATAPERTMAAIHSFSGPLILMLGGRDKDLPWGDLATLIHRRVDHVVLFGEAADKIEAALGPRVPGNRPFSQAKVGNLKDAILAASRVAQPGFVVLFSPGGTSYDEFKDFAERGKRFTEWVLAFSEELR